MTQVQVLSIKGNSKMEESFGGWGKRKIKDSAKWVADLRAKMSLPRKNACNYYQL